MFLRGGKGEEGRVESGEEKGWEREGEGEKGIITQTLVFLL